MSTTLHNRIQERQRLARELDQLDARASKVRSDIARIDNDLSERFLKLAQALGGDPAPAASDGLMQRRDGLVVSGARIDEWIEKVIRSGGRPLKPKEIWREIVDLGVSVSGKDPVNNISARLYSSDRFYRLKSGIGWWLEGEPLPGGN